MFAAMANVKGDVLMTYGNAADVQELALAHGFKTKTVASSSV